MGVHAEYIDKDTAIRAVQLLEYFYETMFTERDFAGEELQKLEQKLYEKTVAIGKPRISRREILRTVCSNRTEKCELLLDTLLAERKIAVLNGKRKDSFEVLTEFLGKIGHVHCKDRTFEVKKGETPKATVKGREMYSSPVGSGCIQMKEIVEKILASGYDDYFAIEHFGSCQQLQDIETSAAWLNQFKTGGCIDD